MATRRERAAVEAIDENAAAIDRRWLSDRLQERGFADAISAHEGDDVAVVQRQRELREKRRLTIGFAEIVDLDHA